MAIEKNYDEEFQSDVRPATPQEIERLEEKYSRPPIGLTPKFVRDADRLKEIIEAINRYIEAGRKVPLEWIVEYNSLVVIKER